MVPISTCNPWNPVDMKKVVPYTESDKVKLASAYSNACKRENVIPKIMVIISLTLLDKLLFSREWWHQVIDTPDDKSNSVLSNGIFTGLNGVIGWGGQNWPNSTAGDILLWKNAQKKEVKNKISDRINISIPICNPTVTCFECAPWVPVSKKIFFHHLRDTIDKDKRVTDKTECLFLCIHKIIPLVSLIAAKEESKGQGLFSTIWNEWYFFNIKLLGFVWIQRY